MSTQLSISTQRTLPLYVIEPIAEAHIDGFHAAVDQVARERKYLAFLEAPPLEETREFVRANMAAGNPQFVVVSEGRVVGWCDATRNVSRPVHSHSASLGIGLLPEYRHAGIGRHLMEKTIAATWQTDMTRIQLTVRQDNRNAVALYKSLGFTVEGMHWNAVCVDGVYSALVSMALLRDR